MRNTLAASSLRSAWTKGRLTGSLQSPKEQDSLANWGAQGQTAPQKARWLRQAWLVVVLADIRLIVVISQALSSRYSTTADDAGLEIRDYGVHLTGGKLAGCWLKVIRRRTQWPPVTWMNGVCAILEGGHPCSDAATTDGRLQRLAIEPRRPQICSSRIIVVLLIPICEGTVAIRAPRGFPGPQPGADVGIVLRA